MPFKKLVQTIANVTGTSIHDIVKDLDDSFYNLGGTSLNSLTVISELRKLKFYICKSSRISYLQNTEANDSIFQP